MTTTTWEDLISLDNGRSVQHVSDLSDDQIMRCWDAAVALMEDDLREEVHMEFAPCSHREFLATYCHRKYFLSGEPLIIG